METITKEHLGVTLNFALALIQATESLLFAAKMYERIPEEVAHAQWLADDMANLGIGIGEYDYEAAAIAGAQYYHIFHADARLLLGYMAALECNIMSLDSVEMLERKFGSLPCLRHHAVHDIEHGQWVLQQIQAIEEPRIKQLVIGNYHWTCAAIRQVIERRIKECPC